MSTRRHRGIFHFHTADRTGSLPGLCPTDKASLRGKWPTTLALSAPPPLLWEGVPPRGTLNGTQQHIFIMSITHQESTKKEPTSCTLSFLSLWAISPEFPLPLYCLLAPPPAHWNCYWLSLDVLLPKILSFPTVLLIIMFGQLVIHIEK